MAVPALLNLSYFGPVQYFSKFLLYPVRIIEQYDHYSRQTYRNRCLIMGANGIIPLSVPVMKGTEHKILMRDVRIDYSRNWRKLHWNGIESAYGHSPFFEYYRDELREFLKSEYEFLKELNLHILDYLLENLGIDPVYRLSQEYTPGQSSEKGTIEFSDRVTGTNEGSEAGPGSNVADKVYADFRDLIHPKRDYAGDEYFSPVAYTQVFSDKHGFMPNLSILDLLLNEGPNAGNVLAKCINLT